MLAESFSRIGVPVFMADVKGDLSGIRQPGKPLAEDEGAARATLELDEPQCDGCPVTFWDVFGEQGHPVRATVSDMGPLLLARHAQPQRDAGRRAARSSSRSPTTTACCCST